MYVIYLSTDGDSTIEFPIPLDVKNYKCSVVDISGEVKNEQNKELFLCSDVCEESFIGNIKVPVLTKLKRKRTGAILGTIDHVIWLKVMRPTISSIRLYIATEEGKVVSLGKRQLQCTVLFSKPGD